MNDTTGNDVGTEEGGDDWAAAMAEQAEAQPGDAAAEWDAALAEEQSIQQAPMQALEAEGEGGPSLEDVNLDVILDIPVSISMEVGSTKISIRNLLKLNQGSVVELDRLAGEPLDVMVNGTLIAHGEVVVVNEKYGIRLTDVISAAERIKKLK